MLLSTFEFFSKDKKAICCRFRVWCLTHALLKAHVMIRKGTSEGASERFSFNLDQGADLNYDNTSCKMAVKSTKII